VDSAFVVKAGIVTSTKNERNSYSDAFRILDSLHADPRWLKFASVPQIPGDEHVVVAQYSRVTNTIDKTIWITELFLPCQTAGLTIDGRVAFNEILGTRFHTQAFADGFSDLYNITRNYLDFEFDKVRRVLESEKRRSPAKFQFFGTEVPSDRLAVFGIPIVLLMQLYLFVHLKNVPSMPGSGKAAMVPWIGLYGDVLGRLLMLGSTVLLEPVAVGVLAWVGTGSSVQVIRLLSAAGAASLALALGMLTVRTLSRIRLVPTASSPLKVNR
jgi:hypothetical protein